MDPREHEKVWNFEGRALLVPERASRTFYSSIWRRADQFEHA